MNTLNGWDWTALVLVIIGGLNLGFVALNPNYDVVALLSGGTEIALARLIYGLIGLAAIYLIFVVGNYARK